MIKKYTILATTGTSILTNGISYIKDQNNQVKANLFPTLSNLIKSVKSKNVSGKIEIQTMNYIEENKPNFNLIKDELKSYINTVGGKKASAEINTIESLKEQKIEISSKNTKIIFFSSETFTGQLCLENLIDYFMNSNFQVENRKIIGLNYNTNEFTQRGIISLVNIIIDAVEDFSIDSLVLFAVTGGFKAEFAYITLIGSLYRTELYYIHEAFRKIIRLPTLPIQLNRQYYLQHKELFEWLSDQPRTIQEIKANVPNYYLDEDLKFFLEPQGYKFTLAPIGEILKKYYGRSRVLVIVDAPNSGDLDLRQLSEYVHDLDNNCRLKYVSSSHRHLTNQDRVAYSAGYEIIKKAKDDKDIDDIVIHLIDEEVERKKPANLIILGTKDGDYTKKISSVRLNYNIEFKIATGNNNYANLYDLREVEVLPFKWKPIRNLNDLEEELRIEGFEPRNLSDHLKVSFNDENEKYKIIDILDTIKEKFNRTINNSLKEFRIDSN